MQCLKPEINFIPYNFMQGIEVCHIACNIPYK